MLHSTAAYVTNAADLEEYTEQPVFTILDSGFTCYWLALHAYYSSHQTSYPRMNGQNSPCTLQSGPWPAYWHAHRYWHGPDTYLLEITGICMKDEGLLIIHYILYCKLLHVTPSHSLHQCFGIFDPFPDPDLKTDRVKEIIVNADLSAGHFSTSWETLNSLLLGIINCEVVDGV